MNRARDKHAVWETRREKITTERKKGATKYTNVRATSTNEKTGSNAQTKKKTRESLKEERGAWY